MPWPKYYTQGCCVFCRQEYRIQHWHQGVSWHRCPGADREKKRRKNASNREWNRLRQAAKGLTVTPREPGKKKAKQSDLDRRQMVKEKRLLPAHSGKRYCHRCGKPLKVNYFNCETCLEAIGDIFNLAVAQEGGYSRHVGHFVSES